jgi:hypothetical protein
MVIILTSVPQVSADRAPELIYYLDNILAINTLLESDNIQNGFIPCDPGRVCERVRRGRRVEQARRWREAQPGYPSQLATSGYHPADSTMPSYVKYMRRWVDARIYQLDNSSRDSPSTTKPT